jgi:hypothetical protein
MKSSVEYFEALLWRKSVILGEARAESLPLWFVSEIKFQALSGIGNRSIDIFG